MEQVSQMENPRQLEVITSIKTKNPELISDCYAVGLWLWAEFDKKLSQEEVAFLKELGFRWNFSANFLPPAPFYILAV